MGEVVLHTEGLTKVYRGGVRALENLNIELERGDVVGYLGPNGAGKTTTIKILTNLIRPTSGSAFIMGVDVQKQPEVALSYIGCLVEVPGVYEYLTPEEMLTYLAKIRGLKNIQERIDEILERYSLLQWKNKKLRAFSTGMRRRFALATAVLHDPEILILDEPALGLDPEGIRDVRNILKSLRNEGKTIFLSSHLLNEVSEICEKVILLSRGKVVAEDSVEHIRLGMGVRVGVEVLHPPTQEQLDAIKSQNHVKGVVVSGTILDIDFEGSREDAARLLTSLIESGLSVVGYGIRAESLEEAYMHLMGYTEGGG